MPKSSSSGPLRLQTHRVAAVLAAAVVLGATGRARCADDFATAKALLKPLERDLAHRPIIADAASHATEALNTAARLRSAGDETHAKTADGVALEWAETASDLVRAADEEASSSDLRRKAVAAQARLERARAQVEEGIARVGRMRAELDEASAAVPTDHRSNEAHASDQSARKRAGSPTANSPKNGTSGDSP